MASTATAPTPSATPAPPPTTPAKTTDTTQIGNYKFEKTIGQGTYGKVKLAINTDTNEKVAVKVIEKSQIQSPKQVARLQREIRFLKLLHHPHIVKVFEVIETDDAIFIVMEYAAGGELFDYIVAHKRVKEKEARSFFRMVLSAVDYCHRNAVIHRDLKPENLLLDESKCIKIIDFGFGNNFKTDGGLLDTFCGSPFYAAPEMILGKKYEGPEVDMWSLGVILFALLCGHLPFDDDNMKELYKKIASGTYTCPDYLMPNARHLIGRLITVDPKKRATLDEVLEHPWVNEGYDRKPYNYLPDRPVLESLDLLDKSIVARLQAFGYGLEEINKAFTDYNPASPHAIRATYFLLKEMVDREVKRQQRLSSVSMSPPATTTSNSSTQQTQPILPPRRKSLVPDSTTHKPHIPDIQKLKLNDYSSMTNLTPTSDSGKPTSRRAANKSEASPLRLAIMDKNSPQFISTPNGLDSGPLSAPVISEYSGSSKQRANSLLAIDTAKSSQNQQHHQTPPTSIPNTSSTTTSHYQLPLSATDASSASSVRRTSKLREELRAVSGWFLNFNTTSSKSPDEIVSEITRVLQSHGITYSFEGPYCVFCEVDITGLLTVPLTGGSSVSGSASGNNLNTDMTIDSTNSSPFSPATQHHLNRKKNPHLVSFQMEVCKAPKVNMVGLKFRRVSGGVWNYKRVCQKLLASMNL